jgi:hypothetical protein
MGGLEPESETATLGVAPTTKYAQENSVGVLSGLSAEGGLCAMCIATGIGTAAKQGPLLSTTRAKDSKVAWGECCEFNESTRRSD